MNKLFKKTVSFVMSLALALSLVSVNTYATETDTEFNVICIGDSTSNGYMLADYGTAVNGTEDDPNGIGFLKNGSASSYVKLLQTYFNGNMPEGYESAEVLNLTMAGMRTDEFRAILDEEYKNSDLADYFCDSHMNSFSNQFRASYADNFEGDEYWQNIVKNNSSGSYSTMHDYYTEKVTEAELIVLDTTMNNFGTYLCSRLQSILGMNGFDPANYSETAEQVLAAATDLTETELAVITQGVATIDAIAKAQFSSMGESAANAFAAMFEYCYADFCVNYSYNLKKIAELNPDAMVVVVNTYNGMNGLTIASGELQVDFGAFWGEFMGNVDKYITDYANYNNLEHSHADLSKGISIFMDELASGDLSLSYIKRIITSVYDDFGADTVAGLLYNGVVTTLNDNYSEVDSGISAIGTINAAKYLVPVLSVDDFSAENIRAAYESNVDTSKLMDYATTIVMHDGYNKILKLLGQGISETAYQEALVNFKNCARLMAFDQILSTLIKAANYTTIDIGKLFVALGDSGYMNLVGGVIAGTIQEGSDDYDIAMSVLQIYDRFLSCNGIGTHPNAKGCSEKYDAVVKAIQEVIAAHQEADPHTHTEVIDKAVEATCSTAGLTEGSHCSECNKVIKAQEGIPALGHDYKSVVTKEATEDEEGIMTYTCSRCKDSYTEAIAKLPHSHVAVTDSAVEATCTTAGLTEGSHCEKCNEVIQAQEEIPALGHDYKGVVTKEATEDEDGVMTYTCSRCKDSYTEVIAKLAHSHTEEVIAAVEPTCTETGLTEGKRCKDCGETIQAQEVVAALGHDYKTTVVDPTTSEKGYTLHECTRCGDSYKDNYIDVIEIVLPYTDVNKGNWFYSWVQQAYELGLMTGKQETTFAPYDNLSRGQLATILYRMSNSPDVTYSEIFPDVADGKYYSEAVIWAYENGIVTGYKSDGTFKPTQDINRQELALMLYRYAAYCDVDVTADIHVLDNYPDMLDVSTYAKKAMAWAVENGLITGDNGNLNPKKTANRAQASKMVVMAYKAINA